MPRLKRVNIFAFIVLGLFLAASGLVAVITLIEPSFADQTALQTLIIYVLSFGLPAIVYGFYVRRKEGQPLAETFSFRKLPLKSLLLCIALGFLVQPLMSLVATLASLVFTDLTTDSVSQLSSMPLPLFILTVGVLPAFFEELVCRGMLLDGYRETPLWYMLVIPALFFGLLHLNFQQISYAFLAGLFLAYLVKVTGSIWASMTVHLIVNGFQSFLVWLTTQSSLADDPRLAALIGAAEEATPLQQVLSALLSAGIVLPFFILCLYLLRRLHRQETPAPSPGQQPVYPQGPWPVAPAVPATPVRKKHWAEDGILMYVLLGLMILMALIVELFLPYLQQFM